MPTDPLKWSWKTHRAFFFTTIPRGASAEKSMLHSFLNEIVNKISRLFPVIKYKELGFEDSFDKYLKLDKKNINSIYQFTLIKNIGDSVVNVSVMDSDVLESLYFYDQIYRDGYN